MRSTFCPSSSTLPRFRNTMERGHWHLVWQGGRCWLRTVCGRSRAFDITDELEMTGGTLCAVCAGIALRIIGNWNARRAEERREVFRERMRILRGFAEVKELR